MWIAQINMVTDKGYKVLYAYDTEQGGSEDADKATKFRSAQAAFEAAVQMIDDGIRGDILSIELTIAE